MAVYIKEGSVNVDKELPLANPPIKGLHYLANPLAMLFDDENILPWFYSDYIQLIWYKDVNFLSFHGKYISEFPTSIPWLEFQCLEKEFAIRAFDICDLFIKAIDEGWYIISSYDEFFIPNTSFYKKQHFKHDFMIYGYDLNNQVFISNVYTQKMVLEKNIIDFTDFHKGFIAGRSDRYEFNRINFYRKKREYKYDFNVSFLIEQLEDYLNSMCSDRKYTVPDDHVERAFGMEIYDYIIDIFQSKHPSIQDARILYMLWEHKKCMRMRVEYMVKNNLLVDSKMIFERAVEIENLALKIKALQLKLCINNDRAICDRIVTILQTIYEKEKMVIIDLITEMKKINILPEVFSGSC